MVSDESDPNGTISSTSAIVTEAAPAISEFEF